MKGDGGRRGRSDLAAGGTAPDSGGRVGRVLGRTVRLALLTIWGTLKLLAKGLWRLFTPSKRERQQRAARRDRNRAA